MQQITDTHLTKGHCVPCEGGTKPLAPSEFDVYLPQLPKWTVSKDATSIQREFIFDDFQHALAAVNTVAQIAEKEGHHPDMNLFDWKHVSFTLSTHAIGGLSINDFVLAAKIDEAVQPSVTIAT